MHNTPEDQGGTQQTGPQITRCLSGHQVSEGDQDNK